MKTLKLFAAFAIMIGALSFTACKEKNKEIILTESDLSNYYFQMSYVSSSNQQKLVMVAPDNTSGLKVHWHRLGSYRNPTATLTNAGTDGTGTLTVMGDDGNPIFTYNLRKDKDGKISVSNTNFMGLWSGVTSLATKAQSKSEMSAFNFRGSVFDENNQQHQLAFSNISDEVTYNVFNPNPNPAWTIGYYKLQGLGGFKITNETVMGVVVKEGNSYKMLLDIGDGTLKNYTKSN